jgi:hypothetical protein
MASPGMGMRPWTAIVTEVTPDKVRVGQLPAGSREGPASAPHGVWMPRVSVAHFVNDLRGLVYGPPAKDRLVSAVLAGKGELLGRGDDGVVFRVGRHTVKVSTTVPYQPFNPGHKTPREAIARMVRQHEVSEAMRRDGVPGIFPSKLVVHGDKAFLIRPFVNIPSRLTRAQLDAVARSVEIAHSKGWVFRDDLQVGEYQGRLYHFDTGKAERSTTRETAGEWQSEEASDLQRLKYLFREHGERYLTAAEQENPLVRWEEALAEDPRRMTPEQKKAMRRQIMRLRDQISTFIKNHPGDVRLGLWEDPEYVAEEFRLARLRYADDSAKMPVNPRGR